MLPKNAYLNGFAHINGLGPMSFGRLMTCFNNDYESAWCQAHKWPKGLLSYKNWQAAIDHTRNFSLQAGWQDLQNRNLQTVACDHNQYPKLLKEAKDRPFILYYRGCLPANNKPLLTIVGARKISEYGRQVIDDLVPQIIKAGIGVISGLAFGVDARCHQVSLDNNGYTAAVLGSGADLITPMGNYRLGRDIINSGGAIMSEFVPGTESCPGNFPRRNRILAALTPATLVIEAGIKSGARITVQNAIEYGRDAGAIPGSIFSPVSEGCNFLLGQGAKVVQSINDIFGFFGMENEDNIDLSTIDLNDQEKLFLSHLSLTPVPLDVLTAKLNQPSPEILSMITNLELKKIVMNVPGHGYKLRKIIQFDKTLPIHHHID